MTRPRRPHERRLHWVVIAVDGTGRGHGHCGDVGHRHEVDEDAYACPWWPPSPAAPVTMFVRQVLLERGQLSMRGIG